MHRNNSVIPRLATTGVIAAELKVAVHRIVRILATRPHIRPAALAGNARLFDRQSVAMIRHELNAIEARRCRRPELLEA